MSKLPVLVQFRGSGEFGAAMDALRDACNSPDNSALVEKALRLLAARYKVVMPERARPVGTNRHGEPKRP